MSSHDENAGDLEQRFSAALDSQATRLSVPADGLDQIRARISKRRRGRRAAWLVAAAALVIVVGAVGVALRSTSSDSAPYVGSNGLPLLGFNDQPLALSAYVPGGLYAVPDFAHQNNGIVTSFVVWADGVGYDPALPPLQDTEETTIAGQTATLGSIEVEGRSYIAVEWEPAPGYQGLLSVDAALSADPRADAKAAAQRVVEVDQAAFETALTGQSPQGDYALPPLIPNTGTAGVDLLEVRSGSRLTLGFDNSETNRSFVGLQVFAGGDRTDYGDRVLERPRVRGTDGEIIESSAADGDTFRLLRWSEAGRTYQLRFPTSMSNARAVELTDALRSPTAEEWHGLLFPTNGTLWPGDDWFNWLGSQPSTPS